MLRSAVLSARHHVDFGRVCRERSYSLHGLPFQYLQHTAGKQQSLCAMSLTYTDIQVNMQFLIIYLFNLLAV